jgi:hypothetical protein
VHVSDSLAACPRLGHWPRLLQFSR